MDKKLKEIEEIKDPFFRKATLIVGRGDEDDAWLIEKKDFNDYATALQSYMRKKMLLAEEGLMKYIIKNNGNDNKKITEILVNKQLKNNIMLQEIQKQLKSEDSNG